MAREIDVIVGKKSYRMVVDDEQEVRVRAVAEQFDGFVQKMQMASGANVDRDRLLVLAGIMMADEFMTTTEQREQQDRSVEEFHNSLASRLEQLVQEG